MKIFRTVQALLLLAVLGAALSCTPPSQGPPAGSTASSATRPPAAPPSATADARSAPPGARSDASAQTVAAPSPSADPPDRESPTGSAYFGCGEPIPVERLWDETTESQVFEAISMAKACARAEGRKLLLEFVAPWCADCREMAKLDETPVVARALRERFERVRINVGKWDRHEGLRESFGVKALATYVVIDPKTSKQLAKTTLEPITKRGPKLGAEDWARWLSSR